MIKLLLCNAYGCILKSTEKHVNITPCGSRADCIRLLAKGSFRDCISINPNLSIFQFSKPSVKVCSPVLCAVQILELSKLKMYTSWDLFRDTFGIDNIKLIKIQTDSLAALVKDPQNRFFENLQSLSNHFDFSNLDSSHALFSEENRCRFGKWKLESLTILEMISLKPKIASYIETCVECGREFSANCGLCSSYIKRESVDTCPSVAKRIAHDFYRDFLTSENISFASKFQLAQKGIDRKIGFSRLDIRRTLAPNGVDTFAIGFKNGDM
jgi:hypothetical protein